VPHARNVGLYAMKHVAIVIRRTEIRFSGVNSYVHMIILKCMDRINCHCHCRTAKH